MTESLVGSIVGLVVDAARGGPGVEVCTVTGFNVSRDGLSNLRVQSREMEAGEDAPAAWLPSFAASVDAGWVSIGSTVLVAWAAGQAVVIDRVLADHGNGE